MNSRSKQNREKHRLNAQRIQNIREYDEMNEINQTDRDIRNDSPIRDFNRIVIKRASDTPDNLEIHPIHIHSTGNDGEDTAGDDDYGQSKHARKSSQTRSKRRRDHFDEGTGRSSKRLLDDDYPKPRLHAAHNQLPELIMSGSIQSR